MGDWCGGCMQMVSLSFFSFYIFILRVEFIMGRIGLRGFGVWGCC